MATNYVPLAQQQQKFLGKTSIGSSSGSTGYVPLAQAHTQFLKTPPKKNAKVKVASVSSQKPVSKQSAIKVTPQNKGFFDSFFDTAKYVKDKAKIGVKQLAGSYQKFVEVATEKLYEENRKYVASPEYKKKQKEIEARNKKFEKNPLLKGIAGTEQSRKENTQKIDAYTQKREKIIRTGAKEIGVKGSIKLTEAAKQLKELDDKEKATGFKWLVGEVAQATPQFLSSIGVGLATTVATKNPALGVKLGMASTFAQTTGSLYQDMKNYGGDDSKAREIAITGGIISAAIERLPLGSLLNKLPMGGEIKENILKKLGYTLLTQGTIGAGEEGAQQLVENTARKAFIENQGWLQALQKGVEDGTIDDGLQQALLLGGIMQGGAGVALDTTIEIATKDPQKTIEQANQKIDKAINTPANERTPEQQEIVKTLMTQELSPQQAISLVANDPTMANTIDGNEIIKMASEAQIEGKNVRLDFSEGKGEVKVDIIEKGQAFAANLEDSSEESIGASNISKNVEAGNESAEVNLPDSSSQTLTEIPESLESESSNTLSSKRTSFLSEFSMTNPSQDDYTKYFSSLQEQERPLLNNLKKITDAVGGDVVYRVKKQESLARKLVRKEGRPLGDMNDTLAATITVKSLDDVDNLLSESQKTMNVTKVTDYRKTPTFLGYKAIHMDVQLDNGAVVEVQLNTKDGLYQKQWAHDIYDKWRKYIENNGATTIGDVIKLINESEPDKLTEFIEDVQLSRRIYSGEEKIDQKYIDAVDKKIAETKEKVDAKDKKQVYDYQSTQLDLEGKDAEKIVEFAKSIPDEQLHKDPSDNYKAAKTGREDAPHITVLYGLDNKIEEDEIRALLSETKPITVKLDKTSLFKNDEYEVLKVDIESPELFALNKKLNAALDTPGETFKDYKPHATIAYLKKGEGEKYVNDTRFEGDELTINDLTFSKSTGEMVKIPLGQTSVEERTFDKAGRETTGKVSAQKRVLNTKEVAALKQIIEDKIVQIEQFADSPEKITKGVNQLYDDIVRQANGDKVVLSALRTQLNKEMFALAGAGGNYKEAYATLQTIIEKDPELGPVLSNMEDKVKALDEMLLKAQEPARVKPTVDKVASGKRDTTPSKETPVGTGKPKNSRLFNRVREMLGEDFAEQNRKYNVLDLEKQADQVVQLIEEDPKRATRIARGFEEPPSGSTQNAFAIALAELARQKGDFVTAARLYTDTSLRSTRLGQEIVTLRGNLSDKNPLHYVKRIVNLRLERLSERYKGVIETLDLKENATPTQKAQALVKHQAKQVAKQMTKQQKRIQSAQEIINALICK